MVKIAGSTTVLPIASRSSEALNARHSQPVFTVNAGGSGVGIHGVGSGLIQVGLISRNITEIEKKRYSDVKFNVHLVGRDAVACVVSSEIFNAGVKSLSRQQIKDIYLGKIINWKQLGGPDKRIVVIDKEMHRGTRHVFMQYIFGKPNARAPGARLVTGSNNEEQTKITQSDAAIGMLSFAWINEDVVGIAIRDGSRIIEPSLKNIQNETYPIMRNLSLVTAGKPEGHIKDFINYVLSSSGKTIVREAGYIPTESFTIQKVATAK
ncbi:MAG: phosphate ABC transporter substrate-binding protein [Nitrospinales bacterium]